MNPTLRVRGGWGTALKTMSTQLRLVGKSQERIYSEGHDPAALDDRLQAALNIRRIEDWCWTFPDATSARSNHLGIAA